jgi:hypothetical protein
MGVEADVPKQISSVIPHFWFDILGRIIPGAFLLVGLFSEDWHTSLTSFVHRFAADFPLTSDSVGFFLLFSAASFFVGHFLGVLSYYFIAWPVAFLWPVKRNSVPKASELPIPEVLKRSISAASETPPSTHSPLAFWRHQRILEHKQIAKESETLAHWLWIRSPELAALPSRWAADALGGSSVALVSAVLLALKWSCISTSVKTLLILLFFCGVKTHHYYKNKAITRSFDFCAMFEPNPGGEQSKKP